MSPSRATLATPPTRVPSSPYLRPVPIASDTLRLDGNEGSEPPGALLAMAATLPLESLRNYPDLEPLQRAIAARHGVEADRVVVTAGADDAMDRVFRAFAGPGDEVIVPTPTFEMVHRFAQTSGAEVRTTPWGNRFPLAEVAALIGDATRMVVVISPNNPTGRVVSAAELSEVAQAAGDALVLFDHVYAEYADQDLSAAALEHPNVVVLRTFSKAFGLAGCRVGYALAAPEIAAVLRNVANPYPVSSVSAHLALERLTGSRRDIEQHIERVRQERGQLTARLAALGIDCPQSQGNFLLADFGAQAAFVDRGLASLGVLVRRFPDRPEISSSLRITLPGDQAKFTRLLRVLDTVLEPQALLFDLDGVLADVEDSYRRSALETIASFGASVTREELRAASLGEDANNDWVLCRRLLAERGLEFSLAEVTERFQTFYLGVDGRAGYRERERLIVPRGVLAGWAKRLPLAVVTGRPRAEAEWFLERHGLGDLFSAVITLEDARPKPDPAPVRLALEWLGVERAWMLGDTPDDVAAARGARVLPLAVPAPSDDAPETRLRLSSAGAGAVLESTLDLENLL
jgi:histidinol-phosphate aminotransferase